LAQRGGYDSFIAESVQGPYHVALLSRLPIRRAVNLSVAASLNRSAFDAVIDVGGTDIQLVGVHLPSGFRPEVEQQRIDEVNALLAGLTGDLPTCLLGDFNSHAPWHSIEIEQAPPHRRDQCRAADRGDNAKLLPHLQDRGWTDIHHQYLGGNVPHTFETGHPFMRVDYLLADATLAERVTEAGVDQRGFAPYCSDHFPIWADFSV